ncbi:gonadotropin-releasing hormone II receptor-like [Stegodyphus dumicola]|uniref:gonadotropin-releasing hormone II receptor-like n=1 Tax=Stegodyphus dumicola TaxID=202533 RepID=UPI0015AB9DC7|nr:gonadotropin-releasing hormone II receptor-like [Stegodyphus dumicola]
MFFYSYLIITIITSSLGVFHISGSSINSNVAAVSEMFRNMTLSSFPSSEEIPNIPSTEDENSTFCAELSSASNMRVSDVFYQQQSGVWTTSRPIQMSEMRNETCVVFKHAPVLTSGAMFRVVILSSISLVSLVGNVAVLITIGCNQKQRQSTIYLLIGILAMADLFVTTFCVIPDAIWTYTVQWLADDITCKTLKFLQMFSLYFSTFILVVIGYDRFCAVRFPIQRLNSKKRARRMLFIIGILSAVFSSPQAFIFRVVKGPFIEEFYQCVTYGFYTEEWQEQLYTMASLVLMFLLPLFILTFTYVCTFYTIAKKEHSFSDRNTVMDTARRNLLRKAKMKALMITVVIMVVFIICWAPYYSTMIIFIFLKPDEQLSQDLQSAVFFFGSSTAMINPLIYGAFHLVKRPGKKKLPTNSSASSKAENTVMLVAYRRSRGVANKVRHVLPSYHTDTALDENLKMVQKNRRFSKSLYSLPSWVGHCEKNQEHSL